jgi:pimeloyl-ACP methyl ester carboxylesterase
VTLPAGRALNLYCVGSGTPTVLLESGIGGFAYDWRSIQAPVAGVTRVCSYDRAGLGMSPPGPFPRDTRAEVSDLEALLDAASIRPPYVLVGHSMGGYNVRLFASRHLRDVAGVVLVDPSAQNQIPILEAALPDMATQDRNAVSRARACADPHRTKETASNCARAAPASFPSDLAARFAATQTIAASQAFSSEVESFLTVASSEVTAESRSFGAIPLIILTRGELSSNMTVEQAQTEWRLWNRMHDDLAKLSTNGSNRVVAGAGHYIQLDRPAAVIGAVREVVNSARGRIRESPAPHQHR